MGNHLRQRGLYFLVFVLSLGVLIVALGGGLFGQQGPWFAQWQHKMFFGLCHQDPYRSFWINGTPMAVCSRCFGIYSSFFLGWLILPWAPTFTEPCRNSHTIRWALVAMLAVNVIDVFGNILGFWQNTLVSRYVLGAFIGILSALVLGLEIIENIKTNGIQHYGTDTRNATE